MQITRKNSNRHVHTHAHTRTHTQARTHMHACACTHARTHTCTHAHAHSCTWVLYFGLDSIFLRPFIWIIPSSIYSSFEIFLYFSIICQKNLSPLSLRLLLFIVLIPPLRCGVIVHLHHAQRCRGTAWVQTLAPWLTSC